MCTLKDLARDLIDRLETPQTDLSPREAMGFLRPKCTQILPNEGFFARLSEGRPLRIKFGIDPTAADIHLGHIVPIMLVRMLATMGHTIDLVIGDFTAQIGDPSLRDTRRAPLDNEAIKRNMEGYTDQIRQFLPMEHVAIHTNGTWLQKMGIFEAFQIFHAIPVAQAMQREDFRTRNTNGEGVSLAELCYGVLMGIDSVHLKTDVEIGGVDQLLNFQQCRNVMVHKGLRPECALMTPILPGTTGDGRKMSKSFGNTIPVSASSDETFGLIMSIPDTLIRAFFMAFAPWHERELSDLDRFIEDDPFETKKQLGMFVVAIKEGLESAHRARQRFEELFSRKNLHSANIRKLPFSESQTLLEVLFTSGSFSSKNALRTLFQGNAVRRIEKGTEAVLSLQEPATAMVVRVGKRHVFQLEAQ